MVAERTFCQRRQSIHTTTSQLHRLRHAWPRRPLRAVAGVACCCWPALPPGVACCSWPALDDHNITRAFGVVVR
eukprot:48681-Lingulodinium_polyedra.AAC.1